MSFDYRNMYSTNQAVCNAGDEWSDDNLDHGATDRRMSVSGELALRMIVTEAFTDMASGMRVVLKDDAVNTFNSGTLKEHTSSPVLLPAQLTLGAEFNFPLSDLALQQYSKVYYVPISQNATAGKVTVGLVIR